MGVVGGDVQAGGRLCSGGCERRGVVGRGAGEQGCGGGGMRC